MEYRFGGGGSHIMKHVLIVLVGGFILYMLHQLPFHLYSYMAPALIVFTILLLILTIFAGNEINEARRWLSIPLIGFTFQTSDFAKVVVILYLARNIATKQAVIKDFKTAFVPLLLPLLVITILIAPADLSSVLLLLASRFPILFVVVWLVR